MRQVDLGAVVGFFHRRESRKVNEDHSDVRIGNVFFAVDPKLRGDQVIVHYDAFSNMQEVQLFSPAGQYLGLGRRYEREKGAHPQPENALRQEHVRRQEQQRASGIDYHSARKRNIWSLVGFANKLARLLGRKGGASGMSAQEMDALTAFYARHNRVTEGLLRDAFERAQSSSIPAILFHLQALLQERND
jgi:hypothetical protein